MRNYWILVGSISGFLSVGMGAFGAHALKGALGAEALAIYQTAAQYQMYHALALIGFGLWTAQNGSEAVSSIPGWAFSIGSVLFCGSLYALALTGIKALGAITPMGGLLFLVGWAMFSWGLVRA